MAAAVAPSATTAATAAAKPAAGPSGGGGAARLLPSLLPAGCWWRLAACLTHVDVVALRRVSRALRDATTAPTTTTTTTITAEAVPRLPIVNLYLHEHTKAAAILTRLCTPPSPPSAAAAASSSSATAPVTAAAAGAPAWVWASLAHVRTLDLSFAASTTDQLLATCLPRLPALTHVNVNACLAVSDAGVRTIVTVCRRLRTLELYTNVHVTNKGVAYVAESDVAPHLTALNLSGCKRLTDAGVAQVAANCPRLVTLDLTRIPLKDASLTAVGAHCHQLRVVRLYACGLFTDAGIAALAKGCPALEVLDLCGTAPLADAGLTALATHCPNLQSLNLTWCPHVTDVGLAALGRLPRLHTLLLHGLTRISNKGIDALAAGPAGRVLRTIDVNGCCGIAYKASDLRARLPALQTMLAL